MFGSKFADSTIFFILLIATLIAGTLYNGYHYVWIIIAVIAYVLLLAAGSYFIGLNFYVKSIHRIPLMKLGYDLSKGMTLQKRERNIILSFDDGPHENTALTLDILKNEKVPALFFLIGKQISGHEVLLKRMIAEGHQIGNHTYSHTSTFGIMNTAAVVEEISSTNAVIQDITGVSPKFFRPPFGVTNPNIAKAIRMTEMSSIGWSVRSYDTMAKDEARLLTKLLRKVRPGAIILLHERCDITVKILPKLIQELRQKEFTFTTL